MAPPLKGIHLNNFRNFTQREESFSNSHTLFKGRNAVGKTNLLEAISFLCPGTGFRKDIISNFSNQDQKENKVGGWVLLLHLKDKYRSYWVLI